MQRWFVVFTKPRREQEAAEQLRNQGFELFLPLLEQQKRRRGQWTVVIEPLFPRYLFLCVDPDQVSVAPVRSTLGVSGFVRFGGVMSELPQSVIDYLKGRCAPGSELIQPQRSRFVSGDQVEIVEGPFAGITAIFQQQRGEDRALILVELLGKANRLTILTDLLTPVEP